MSTLLPAISDTLRTEEVLGETAANNVFIDRAPQGTDLPYIVIRRVSAERTRHLTAADGVVNSSIDVVLRTSTAEERELIAEQMRLLFDGLIRQTIGGTGIAALELQSAKLEDHDTFTEPPHDASDGHVFVSTQEFVFIHDETVPTHT